jgi:hypothetical protein
MSQILGFHGGEMYIVFLWVVTPCRIVGAL